MMIRSEFKEPAVVQAMRGTVMYTLGVPTTGR